MIVLLIYLFLLAAFTGVLYVLYWLARAFQFEALRAWLAGFYAEIVGLLFVPAQTFHLPGLPSLYNYGGRTYFSSFTTDWDALIPGLLRGKMLEEWLLLPLVPALLFSRIQRHRTGRPPSSPGPPRPWVVPSLFGEHQKVWGSRGQPLLRLPWAAVLTGADHDPINPYFTC